MKKILALLYRLSPPAVRVIGLVMLLCIGFVDYITTPFVSFLLLYTIPIAFISWFDNRISGIACAALIVMLATWESFMWWPDVPLFLHLWNAIGETVMFVAFAWSISFLRHSHEHRIKEAEDKYTRILETAIEGIIAIDVDGVIQFVNSRGAALLGCDKEELFGSNLLDLIVEEHSRSKIQTMLNTYPGSPSSLEIQFNRKDNSALWTLASISASTDSIWKSKELVLLLTDITALKKSEEQLRQRYHEISAMQRLSSGLAKSLHLGERLENAVKTVLEVTRFDAGGIYLLDQGERELTLQYHAGVSAEFAARTEHWPAHRGITGHVARSGLPRFVENVRDDPFFDQQLLAIEPVVALASIPLISKEKVLGVLNILHKKPYTFTEGEQMMLQTFGKQIGISIENAKLFETAREQAQQVRKLTLDIVEVQEEERRRFARELHDGLSQLLSTLKINIELAAKHYRSDPDAAEGYLQEVILLTDEAQTEAKQIAYDLRPAILDDFGLRAAIGLQASNFERRTRIVVECHFPTAEMRFDTLIETSIYRIVQELLTNTAKHAEATRVTIQLLVRGSVMALTVSDNGKGFDTTQWLASDSRPHYGLRNIRERVEFLGGTFRPESVLGRGAEFMIELPIGQPVVSDEKSIKAV